LYGNPILRGLGPGFARWALTTTLHGPWQPLPWFSYALDRAVWGLNPLGFHLQNLLWHGASAGLLYLVSLELFPESSARRWAAAFAALTFALHPLRVEAVAWASARRDLMCGFFCLLAVLSHLRGRRGWAIAAYALSLACKASGLGLPLVLALLDWTLRRKRPAAKDFLPYLPFAALAAVMAWRGQAAAGTMTFSGAHGPLDRLSRALVAHAFYLTRTVWPAGLSPMYPNDPDLSAVAAAAVVNVPVAAFAVGMSRRRPSLLCGWLSYVILLAPVLGLVKFGPQLVADRYAYLPGMVLSVLLGAGAVRAVRVGRPAVLAGAALCALLSGLSARQLSYWRDSETLFGRVLSLDPQAFVARSNLGLFLRDEGRLDEAQAQFETALQERPCFAPARNGLGTVFLARGELARAEIELRAAIACGPDMEVYNNLGLVLARERRYDEALFMLDEAVRLAPASATANDNRDRVRALKAAAR
jgi:hypothetical protein